MGGEGKFTFGKYVLFNHTWDFLPQSGLLPDFMTNFGKTDARLELPFDPGLLFFRKDLPLASLRQ